MLPNVKSRTFLDLLPALLSPLTGGGVFENLSQLVGHWMRTHDVEALVYPSARTNAGVVVRQGEIVNHAGWNIVDYRHAPEPIINVMLNMSIGPPPPLPAGVSIATSE